MTYHGEGLESKTPRKGRGWLRLAVVVLIVAVVAGVGLFYRDSLWSSMNRVLAAGDEDPIPVLRIEKTSYQLNVPGIGEITGLESTPVPTPSTRGGGLKVAWLVPEGSFVSAGDTIARFDNVDIRLTLERQENTLQANQERTKVTTGNQATDEKVLGYDRADAEKEYEYAVTVLPRTRPFSRSGRSSRPR